MNLDCPELIADFHKRSSTQLKETLTQDSPINNNSNKRSACDTTEQQRQESSSGAKKNKRTNEFGYERGLEIEKILGATDVYGELMFL